MHYPALYFTRPSGKVLYHVFGSAKPPGCCEARMKLYNIDKWQDRLRLWWTWYGKPLGIVYLAARLSPRLSMWLYQSRVWPCWTCKRLTKFWCCENCSKWYCMRHCDSVPEYNTPEFTPSSVYTGVTRLDLPVQWSSLLCSTSRRKRSGRH